MNAKSQAAPFAALLSGAKKVVVQGFQPRKLDGKSFKYVGVAGVDKPASYRSAWPGRNNDIPTPPPEKSF